MTIDAIKSPPIVKTPIAYLVSLPFLIAFISTLVSFDLLQRLIRHCSYKLHEKLTFCLNARIIDCLKITGLRLKIIGHIPESTLPLIVVTNHQSLMDIPFLTFVLKKFPPRYIDKQELTKWLPFVSYNLRTMGHIIIDRGNSSQAISQIKTAAKELFSAGKSVVIFPEGTRARDGKLKQYKSGGFKSIVESIPDAQVLPITIEGSWKIAFWKLWPVPAGIRVTIVIGEPRIATPYNAEQVLKEIHDATERNIENIRNEESRK